MVQGPIVLAICAHQPHSPSSFDLLSSKFDGSSYSSCHDFCHKISHSWIYCNVHNRFGEEGEETLIMGVAGHAALSPRKWVILFCESVCGRVFTPVSLWENSHLLLGLHPVLCVQTETCRWCWSRKRVIRLLLNCKFSSYCLSLFACLSNFVNIMSNIIYDSLHLL